MKIFSFAFGHIFHNQFYIKYTKLYPVGIIMDK